MSLDQPQKFKCPVNRWGFKMARGQQKIQSQQKAQEKQAKMKKQQGHSLQAQKDAASKAIQFHCTVCKAQMPDPKTYKQHFENKHPKVPLPPELAEAGTSEGQ